MHGVVQKLPKGALVIIKGGDMLGNMAQLEEHDVEVTFQPPEAVSAVRLYLLRFFILLLIATVCFSCPCRLALKEGNSIVIKLHCLLFVVCYCVNCALSHCR